MKLIQFIIILCTLTFILSGCTAGGGGFDPAVLFENSKEPSSKEAQKQIEDIQHNINSNPNYVLNSDEVVFLSEQGVVTDESELKGWVK